MGGIVQCSSLGDKTVALVLIATNQYSMHFSDAFSFRTLALQQITLQLESLNQPAPTNPQTSALVLCLNPAVRGWLNSVRLHPP